MSWMKRVLIYAGLAPFLFIALFPVLWMVITAFKHERDLYSMRGIPFWFYEPPTLKHFHLLFTQTWFGTWFVNTAMVSVCVVVITVATAVPAGYALARLRLPGAGHTATAIFMTYLVPPIILFLPLTYVIGQLGLFDSWWALVLVYPTFTIPIATWLMFGFLRGLPPEMLSGTRGAPGSPGRLRAIGGKGGPSRPPLTMGATRRLRARAAGACA